MREESPEAFLGGQLGAPIPEARLLKAPTGGAVGIGAHMKKTGGGPVWDATPMKPNHFDQTIHIAPLSHLHP